MLGLPIVLAAFGEEATTPVILLIAFHGPILLTAGAATVAVSRSRETEILPILRRTARAIVRNPIVMATLAGLAWSGLGPPLPELLRAGLEPVGRTAIPCALFALGATLGQYELRARSRLLL